MAPAGVWEIQYSLNVLANTVSGLSTFYLDEQQAANVWAGTTKLELLAALNHKNGTTGLDLNLVCNQLASISPATADAQNALSKLAGGGYLT